MRVQIELPGGPGAAHAARSAVSDFAAALADPLPDALVEDIRLLVSELVTNSVRHGGVTPSEVITLTLSQGDGTIRVEVEDPGSGFVPRPAATGGLRTSGYGLVLVDRLTKRWGVQAGDTVRVWFEMDAGTSLSSPFETPGGERVLEPA